MKTKISLHLVFTLCVFFASCTKDKTSEYGLGELNCTINSISWSGKIDPVSHKLDSLLGFLGCKMKRIDGVSVPWEMLSFEFIKRNMNRQTLHRFNPYNKSYYRATSGFGTSQEDGDVACDVFAIDEADSLNNFIQITEATDNFQEIRGVFSVTMYRVRGNSCSSYADTLKIRGGGFHVIYF